MASASGKSTKQDRSRKSAQNLRYKNERRHAKSHIRRIKKHLKKFPDAKDAIAALKRWELLA